MFFQRDSPYDDYIIHMDEYHYEYDIGTLTYCETIVGSVLVFGGLCFLTWSVINVL